MIAAAASPLASCIYRVMIKAAAAQAAAAQASAAQAAAAAAAAQADDSNNFGTEKRM